MPIRKFQPGSLRIDYESDAFPPSSGVPSTGELYVSWDDLLWAAATLGRPNIGSVFRHGVASLYEVIFRWSLLHMSLEQAGPTAIRFSRTAAFKSLDPTEKGSVNYFLGMTLCKTFAEKLLRTPWLLHLDVFRAQLSATTLAGRSRPDFVGQDDAAAWHAFESKGRASVPSAGEKAKAKAQAQRLISVDGQACALHVGAITYFRGNTLRFYWCDPTPSPSEKMKPIELELPESAWQDYYEPITELVRAYRATEKAAGTPPSLVSIDDLDISVGVHPDLLPKLLDRQWQVARQTVVGRRSEFEKAGFRPDGLIVKGGENWRRRRPIE